MSINKRPYENEVEEIKKVRNRIREYVKQRNANVSRDELLRVASKAGIKRSLIYDAANWIQNLEDLDDIDLINWWGYESGGMTSENPAEKKTLWFKYHRYDDDWRSSMIAGLQSFRDEEVESE